MTRFEIGQTYFMRDPFDRAKRTLYQVMRRTPQQHVVFRQIGTDRTFRRQAHVVFGLWEYCCLDAGRFDDGRTIDSNNLAGAEP